MINNITICGRLTKDPVPKATPSGAAVCTFTVAVERNFSNNGQKETDFIPVVTWKGLADTCGKYLNKGSMVAVEGRLQIRTYEANDGSKRTIAEVVATNVQFLTQKAEADRQRTLEEVEPMDDIPWA